MSSKLRALLIGLASIVPVYSAAPDAWRERSIYQVLTDRFALTDGGTDVECDPADSKYCGGTWQGIINKLDYIQDMGFTAVWISPITKQIDIPDAYHGYYQNDLYSVNDHYGSANDLKALSQALHDRDMFLMVDIVANHFAWPGPVDTIDYSSFTPFDSPEHYHQWCAIQESDYDSNQTAVEQCWLGNDINWLIDLDTENSYVVDTLNEWVHDLVTTYSIDGFRIDTVKHIRQDFWPGFNDAAGVYCVGEVANGDAGYACPYQDYLDGILNYPLYYSLTKVFGMKESSMEDLAGQLDYMKGLCKDTTLLAPFLENHDQPRFASVTSDIMLARNAMALAMLSDGPPIIYQGQEQHFSGGNDPLDREALWTSEYATSSPAYALIAYVNQIRNHVLKADAGYLTYQAWAIYTDDTTIATRKGSGENALIGVFTSLGADAGSYAFALGDTGYAEGVDIMEMMSCSQQTAGADGALSVGMDGGDVRVFYPVSLLSGSGICSL